MMKKFSFALIGLACLVGFSVANAADSFDAAAQYKARCVGCHGEDGAKTSGGSPALKGQSAADLQKKFDGYADGSYGGERKRMMESVAKKYQPEERKAFVDHIATL